MTEQTTGTTLVTGGTGKTGRRVVQRLEARGVPVRVASRTEGTRFSWDEPATWAPAARGTEAVYIAYSPDLAVPGAPEVVGAFARVAAHEGVRRLVLLSGRGEEEAQRSEETVAAAGVDLTVVRCSWFSQNFTEGAFLDAIRAGQLALPVADVPEPFVDVDDIADVAVAALTEEGHAGRLYELTGPRALTFAQAVGEIAEAAGRPIAFHRITMEEFEAGMRAVGVPDDVLWLMGYLFTEVLDGRNVATADGVRQALGREPRDFRDFARTAATVGAWDPVVTAR